MPKPIDILCPDNNHSERKYILQLFFEDFFGCQCNIQFQKDLRNYLILYEDKTIQIEDHFFNLFPQELSYLKIENIPERYSLLTGYDLLILFGRDFLEFSPNEIRCGLDVFASSFFFLTRWEEIVLPRREDGFRCEENQLFAVKNNLTKRPLVNEYLDFLQQLFSHLGIKFESTRNFTIFQTHDVDRVYLSTFSELFKNLKRMVFQDKQYKKSFLILMRYIFYRFTRSDPFNSFDDFMDFSDSLGLKNAFFFKASTPDEKGYTYTYNDSRVKRAIRNIENRGHQIGFHPSENTFQNEEQFSLEYNRLLEISSEVRGGRQHNLLYHAGTFSIWEKCNLGYDSGSGFQNRNGFRCGICYDFPIFDINARKKLKLKEIPFVFMDTVFIRNQSTPEEIISEAKEIIDIVIQHHGILCTIWHTNMFNTSERKKFRNSYYKIISYAAN